MIVRPRAENPPTRYKLPETASVRRLERVQLVELEHRYYEWGRYIKAMQETYITSHRSIARIGKHIAPARGRKKNGKDNAHSRSKQYNCNFFQQQGIALSNLYKFKIMHM